MNQISFKMDLFDRVDLLEWILVVDCQTDWVHECEYMLSEIGYRCLTVSTPGEAIECIGHYNVSTVIMDHELPGCDSLALIDELIHAARKSDRHLRFIMATGHATLEIALDAMHASAVDLLEKPIRHEHLQKALLRVRGIELETPARMKLLSQLSTLSAEMQRVSALIDRPAGSALPAAPVADDPQCVTPDFIRRLLRSEAKRRKLGNGALFGDPAWDMLLDLMIAKLQGVKVPVSSACIASGAPTTTALRLINRLVEQSVLRRVPDSTDGRRDFLEADPAIEEQVMAYLKELAKIA